MSDQKSHYERAAEQARRQRRTGLWLAWAFAFAGALEGAFFRSRHGALFGAGISLLVLATFYLGERSALRAALQRDLAERAEQAAEEQRRAARIARLRAGELPLDP